MSYLRLLFLLVFFSFLNFQFSFVYAQVYLSRYVPGNFLSDNVHQVEIKNATGQTAVLDGWLLVTRDYSARLPPNTRIKPNGTLTIAKNRSAEYPAQLELAQLPDFLVRLYSRKVEGAYVALFNAQRQMVDGFYHSQLRNVPFLPDSGALTPNLTTAYPFKLPPEDDPRWGYFQVGADPALGFEQLNGKWRVTSARRNVNVYPAVRFKDFAARFQNDVVTLKWFTDFEENVKTIWVERSADQKSFVTVGSVEGRGDARKFASYTFIDDQTQPKTTYYYRLKHRDENGHVVESKVIEVSTISPPVEFWLEAFPLKTPDARQISIRFYSAYSQRVKIKIIDARSREIALLYANLVYADANHLLRLTEPLPPGVYTLIASTESERYVQRFSISKD